MTQREEKKWELCTALFLTELIHHVTQREEKKRELCTALFLAYYPSSAENALDFSLLHHGIYMIKERTHKIWLILIVYYEKYRGFNNGSKYILRRGNIGLKYFYIVKYFTFVYTVFPRLNAAAFIFSCCFEVRRLFEGGVY